MSDSAVFQLTYVSSAAWKLANDELNTILDTSRANNRRYGVTGLLLHLDGGFLQVLEGPKDAVTTLFRRIGRDPRHIGVRMLVERHVPARLFAGWSMGFDRWTEGAPRTADVFAITRNAIEHAVAPEKAADLAILLRNFYAVHAGAYAS